ncbi:MAG: hypothetical protein ACK4HQ_09465 [Brevinematales bacterium]
MGKPIKTLFVMGCLFVMIPAFFDQKGIWLVLSLLGYVFFALLFWNDSHQKRDITLVFYALTVFSAMIGLDFWHRVFRVGFWVAMVFSEGPGYGRTKFWYLQMMAFFLWGVSLAFSLSSWQWWVGLVDVFGWLSMAGILFLKNKEELRDNV